MYATGAVCVGGWVCVNDSINRRTCELRRFVWAGVIDQLDVLLPVHGVQRHSPHKLHMERFAEYVQLISLRGNCHWRQISSS